MSKSRLLSLATVALIWGCDGVEVAPSGTSSVQQAALARSGPVSSVGDEQMEGKQLPASANLCSILRPCIWNPEEGRLEWATPSSSSEEGATLPHGANICRPGVACAWNPQTGRLEALTSGAGTEKPQAQHSLIDDSVERPKWGSTAPSLPVELCHLCIYVCQQDGSGCAWH